MILDTNALSAWAEGDAGIEAPHWPASTQWWY